MTKGLGLTNITIAGTRYPLVLERGKLAFRRLGSIDLHGANPKIPVSEEWDFRQKSNGAGQTILRDRKSYYYTKGVDMSSVEGARLASRRVTLAPTRVPVDKGAWFFEDTPTGNAQFEAGSGTMPTSVTTKTYSHSNAIATKAGLFMSTNTTNDGTVQTHSSLSLGFSDGINDACASVFMADAAGTSDTARTWSETTVLQGYDGTSVSDGVGNIAAISDFASTSTIELDFTTKANADADIIQYMLFAGADVQAKVLYFDTGTDTSPISVIGTGFDGPPDCVILLSAALPSAGASDDAMLSVGAMDSSGNQWALGIGAVDGAGTSDSGNRQSNTRCLIIMTAGGSINGDASFTSMDPDGFTITPQNSFSSSLRVAALCLKGVQVKATTQTILTAVSNTQDAQDPGFTTTAFFNIGGEAETLNSDQANAAIGVGFATATSEVETSSILDISNIALGSTDSARVTDTAAALSLIGDDTTDPEDDRATCVNIDMGTAGWLTWGIESGTAYYFHTLGFAAIPASETKMVHFHNGQGLTKVSVESNVITERESHNWGADAIAGPMTKFQNDWYMALGSVATAQVITLIGDIGTNNTYGAVDSGGTPTQAHAFENLQDGTVPRLARALNNIIFTTADTSSNWTWGGSFAIGDSTTVITNLIKAPEGLYIGKEDNLYVMDASGGGVESRTPFHVGSASATNGQGMVSFEDTQAVIYNHGFGEFLFEGTARPFRILMESIREMGLYPGIDREPFKGSYRESAITQDWLYTILTVTENSSTETYILASWLDRSSGRFITHTMDQLSGVCRGLFVDSENRLWTGHVGGGVILYWQLGKDGSPDPGRDSIGRGNAPASGSTTYEIFLGEVDFNQPYITKRLRSTEWVLDGTVDATAAIRSAFRHDGAGATVPTTIITSNGIQESFVSTLNINDTFNRTMASIRVAISSGYDDTDTDSIQVLDYRVNAWLMPQASDFAGQYEIIIDAGKEGSDGQDLDPALQMRTDLLSLLSGGLPVVIEGVGNIADFTGVIVSVAELETRVEKDEVHWSIRVEVVEWVDS